MNLRYRNPFSKPMTAERIAYWKGRLLTPLLGRQVCCRICGDRLGRALFLVKRGGLQCLGLNRERVRVVPCGYYRIEFECLRHAETAPDATSFGELEIQEVVHMVLAHQDGEYLKPYLLHHQSLSHAPTRHVLVYGGGAGNFPSVGWPDKTFCDDPSLRGLTHRQSFTQAIRAGHELLREMRLDHLPVLFTESDVWALRDGYAEEAVRQMTRAGADFAASGLVCVDSSTDGHMARSEREGDLTAKLREAATHTMPPTRHHALGAAWVFSPECLADFAAYPHRDEGCFVEIYIPSFLSNRGWKGVDLAKEGGVFSLVRYRPEHSLEESAESRATGIWFVHPLKSRPAP